MKKTLITATLIAALATAPAVLAEDSYTIELADGFASGNGNYNGWTMSLTDRFFDATASATESPDLGDLSSVLLNSVTINNRTEGSQTFRNVYLAIYQYSGNNTTGTFIGVSNEIATNGDLGGSNTFTFTDVTLDPNDQYQYLFVTSNDAATLATFDGYKSVSAQFGLNVKNINAALPPGDGTYTSRDLNSWQGNYMPNVGISVSATPEPTTATLSLLALAGLCARRRRK